jgi:Uma2 family endonuclease
MEFIMLAPVSRDDEIDYPESDGKPVAESDLHAREIVRLFRTLNHHFAGDANVYVAMNNFIYYREGDPKACFSPDVYVVHGVKKRLRRVYKVWAEGGHTPSVVFEITSKSTKREDLREKKNKCAELGIQEYFLFDPEGDYLKPTLQGYRLNNSFYSRIEPESDGSLSSKALNLNLLLDTQKLLRVRDPETAKVLLNDDEYVALAKAQAKALRKSESATRREATARRKAETEIARTREAAQEEIAKLRAELEQLKKRS